MGRGFEKRTIIGRIPRSSKDDINAIIGKISEEANLSPDKLKIKTELFAKATRRLKEDIFGGKVKSKGRDEIKFILKRK